MLQRLLQNNNNGAGIQGASQVQNFSELQVYNAQRQIESQIANEAGNALARNYQAAQLVCAKEKPNESRHRGVAGQVPKFGEEHRLSLRHAAVVL